MSVITSLNKRAANLAQKALRLGGDFVHPVSDDSGNTPDYNDPNNIISPDGHIDLPHTVEWGEGFPSTTFLDPETGLLTTKPRVSRRWTRAPPSTIFMPIEPSVWVTSRSTPIRRTANG